VDKAQVHFKYSLRVLKPIKGTAKAKEAGTKEMWADAWLGWGIAREMKNRPEEAEYAYEQGLQMDGGRVDSMEALAELLGEGGGEEEEEEEQEEEDERDEDEEGGAEAAGGEGEGGYEEEEGEEEEEDDEE
jgi:hypothetical protein